MQERLKSETCFTALIILLEATSSFSLSESASLAPSGSAVIRKFGAKTISAV